MLLVLVPNLSDILLVGSHLKNIHSFGLGLSFLTPDPHIYFMCFFDTLPIKNWVIMNLDYLGAFFSLLSTLLFVFQSYWAWPMSLLAILVNSYLYLLTGIYADMTLELFYLLSCLYGWWDWKKSADLKEFFVHRLTLKGGAGILLSIGCFYIVFSYFLKTYTHSTVVHLDAITTALSIVGQVLMCYKHIATWVVWFVADSLYVVLYGVKQLPGHVVLMIIYTGLAIWGFYRWHKKL